MVTPSEPSKQQANGRRSPSEDGEQDVDGSQVAAAVDARFSQARDSLRSWIPASYLQAYAKSGSNKPSSSSNKVRVSTDGVPIVRPANLGLGAEPAQAPQLTKTESNLKASVMRDRAKSHAEQPRPSASSSKKKDSSDDEEDSRAGSIKSRAAAKPVKPLFKSRPPGAASAAPAVDSASTASVDSVNTATPPVSVTSTSTSVQSTSQSQSQTPSQFQPESSKKSKNKRKHKQSLDQSPQDQSSVLGFPPEPEGAVYASDGVQQLGVGLSNSNGSNSVKFPYRAPPASDEEDDDEQETTRDASALLGDDSIADISLDGNGQPTSKQKKRKRAKQKRAERRKQAKLSAS